MSAAASLESSVLPDPQDLDGVPSTIVTMTPAAASTTTTSENQAAPAATVSDASAAPDVSVAQKDVGDDTKEDEDGESKPCFMMPCEGMSCNVL